MALEKKVAVSADRLTINKGNVIPPWFPNYNSNDWYNDSRDVSFFYNQIGDNFYIQYGMDKDGWASARFFGQTLEILNEVQNNDGSITARVKTRLDFAVGRRKPKPQGGFDVNYTIRINNVIQYQFSTTTLSEFDYPSRPWQEFNVTVQPQETSNLSAIKLEIVYPNGEFDDREIVIGVGLFNPNPITYVPLAIRKSGTWKDFNSNNGKILRRVNNVWVNKSNEDISTSKQVNKGKNRIRINDQFRQLPKMNGGIT